MARKPKFDEDDWTMNAKRFKPAMKRFEKRLREEEGYAKRMLQEAGIVTKTGRLSKKYGG